MVNSSKSTVNLESVDTNIIESVEDTTSTTSSLVENVENEMVSTDGTIIDSDSTLTPTEEDVESQEDTLQNEDGKVCKVLRQILRCIALRMRHRTKMGHRLLQA